MSGKRIFGIVLFLVGIVCVGFSMYIKGQVEQGKQKISSAQESVDAGNRLFSVSPYTEDIGKGITSGIQKKIDEGKRDVAYYESMAKTLMIIGVICLIVGIIFIVVGKKKRT